MKKVILTGVAATLLAAPTLAFGQDTPETWLLTGSGSGAAPLSDSVDTNYDMGATGGLGLYRSLAPQLQLGARVDAGALPVETINEDRSFDDNTLGLGSLSAALRLRPFAPRSDHERGTGFYLEAAGGPGLLENDVRGFLTPGAGFIIPVGDVGIGPTARYVHVFQPDDGSTRENDLQIATFGIEVVLFDRRAPRYEAPRYEQPVPAPVERFEPAARFETAPQPVEADTDGDGFLDSVDGCVTQAETVNGIDDHDGCPDTGSLVMTNDRVVIDEQTFFAYDSAELRPEGQRLLDEIVALYESSGQSWTGLRVMGHADARGPMPYNQELSRRRAEAVQRYLLARGVSAEIIDIEAYGETAPAIPDADTEREHQLNRRVEFRIVR
jgi:outer membrane protein OmpA-like peptidoglycan-associated protein